MGPHLFLSVFRCNLISFVSGRTLLVPQRSHDLSAILNNPSSSQQINTEPSAPTYLLVRCVVDPQSTAAQKPRKAATPLVHLSAFCQCSCEADALAPTLKHALSQMSENVETSHCLQSDSKYSLRKKKKLRSLASRGSPAQPPFPPWRINVLPSNQKVPADIQWNEQHCQIGRELRCFIIAPLCQRRHKIHAIKHQAEGTNQTWHQG